MNDLTEQWKKGELPEGFYYIKVKEVIANYPLLADCVEGLSYTYFLDYEDYVTEVLAPVPSYEEWKEIVESEEKSHLQADSYYNKILELTDLLEKAEKVLSEVMDCREDREFYKDLADKYYEYKYGKYLNGEQND